MKKETPPSPSKYLLEESIGYLSRRASKLMALRLQKHFKAAGLDISVDQWIILAHLATNNGLNQQQVGDACFRDKASVTRLVDSLEKRQLLYRMPDQNDRRNNLLFLTQEGINLKDTLIEIAEKTTNEGLKEVSETELNAAVQVLKKIGDNFEAIARLSVD